MCEYSSRYWETYQEIEDCDLIFALNTFKYGLLRDTNGIYNSLTRVPPYNFDEFLLRVNECVRVEDDELAIIRPAEEKKGDNGKFDGSKRKEDFNKVSKEGYKGENTVFTKPIHKIMFDIQNQPYFEWP